MIISELLGRIDVVSRECRTMFGALSSAYINSVTTAGSWSIGQLFKHLILVNESYSPVIDSVWHGTYKMPLIGSSNFIVNYVGRTLRKSLSPMCQKKTKTYSLWEPDRVVVTNYIINQFEEHQETLKKLISSSADLIELNTVISSPANRYVVYRIGTAFDIVVAHEEKHLEQAKRMLKALRHGNPAFIA